MKQATIRTEALSGGNPQPDPLTIVFSPQEKRFFTSTFYLLFLPLILTTIINSHWGTPHTILPMPKKRKHKSKSNLRKWFHGFTLIELLVSIAILSVLSTVGLVTYSHARSEGQDAKRRQDMIEIKSALDLYQKSHPGQCMYGVPCEGGSSESSEWSKLANGGTTGAGLTYDGLVPNYLSSLPKDPAESSTRYYYYHGGTICALLDHKTSNDPSCPIPFTCGSQACNFGYSVR